MIAFHDITKQVVYDFQNYRYQLSSLDQLEYFQQGLLKDHLDANNFIDLPTVDEILLQKYPFVDKINPDIVRTIIRRNQHVKRLVDYAVKHKRGEKLTFDPLDEKDKVVLDLAKQFIYDLNHLIYKHELDQLFSNLTFVNNDVNQLFVGTIDVIGKSKKGWILFSLKTSKTSYWKKYAAELYLEKVLFETNSGQKVKEMYILNPRNEQFVVPAKELSQGEKASLFF